MTPSLPLSFGHGLARAGFRRWNVLAALGILAVSLSVSSTGCEAETSIAPVSTEAQALRYAFDEAAASWSVPTHLLQAVGFTASRWHHPSQTESLGLHGIMQLSDESVIAAAKLTGLPEQAIRTDFGANIRAAAALLNSLADEAFAPDLDRSQLESWWTVLGLWSGSRDDRVAESYAGLVMTTLSQGARRTFSDGSTLTLLPRRVAAPGGLGRAVFGQGTTDYPNATWVAADPSNHSTGRTATVDRIIFTTAGGSATAAINTFQDPNANVSVHYLIHWNGTVTQMVREANAAWHSSCYNHRSIGIMFEGFITASDNYTDQMYQAASELVGWITNARGLARTDEIVIGHSDVVCNGDTGPRVSPGEHFDWVRFFTALNGSRLRGEVFFGEDFNVDVLRDDNRLADALVWLDTGDITMSEGLRGRFDFYVPPGTYQLTAEADGYDPGTRSCTVLPDQDTWCSVMVTEISGQDPDPDQGTIGGIVVWGMEGESAFDIIANYKDTRFVAGATVTITPGPVTVTTGADGYFYAGVNPGSYTVFADAEGYDGREAALGAVTVAAGESVWRSVMIVQPPAPAPVITITKPDPGQVFTTAAIAVTGSVTHDKPIATTTVNGAGVSLTGGQFSTSVTLVPGANTIVVSATDTDGVTGHQSVNVTYQATVGTSGVDGFVWDSALGMGVPVEGATVRVGQITTTSEPDGWFTLDVAAGTYALRITADGYLEHADSVMVPQGGRAELLIALDPEGSGTRPVVTISQPQDGQTVHEASLQVSGTVAPADAGMTVTINGSPATYSGGNFSGTMTLSLGSNAVVVSARDALNQTGTAAVTVIYEEIPDVPMSGVDGVVFDNSVGHSSRIAGAVVVIGEEETTTAADGTFSLDVPAGTHEVTVTVHGFQDYQSTVTVVSAERGNLEIGLTPTDSGDGEAVVEITFPADGDVLTTPSVMVAGRINHPDATRVEVNGVEAVIGGANGFTAEINLDPGDNGIEAIAFAGSTELGRTLITVHYTGAGTGGCSCASAAGSTGAGSMFVLVLLALVALARRRR